MNTLDLKSLVLTHLKELGFVVTEDGTLYLPEVDDKNWLRQIHQPARQLELSTQQDWLRINLPHYLQFFADGDEVEPELIEPILVEAKTQQQQNLFRIARLLWSLPFSKGYGRRLRFLIVDWTNGKLIGLLGLQSPPLSFPARDRLFKYPPGQKTVLVNQTMDIYTLGAVPPYNQLLGGKLVALAAASNEVRQAYFRKYGNCTTLMEKRVLPSHLVALTTTSAFGRSSLYNRLKYKDTLVAESLGYTEGYGTFHLLELYPVFRQFLESQGIKSLSGFGTGPRPKWQNIIRVLNQIGLSTDLIRHGVKREVFLFRLVDNLEDYMEGRTTKPVYRDWSFAELAAWWRERWLLPRAQRVSEWKSWSKEGIKDCLLNCEER